MWGGGQFQPTVLTTQYLAARKTRGATDLLCRKTLLVLLQPSARISSADLSLRFNTRTEEFTTGDGIANIAEPGDVVTIRPPEIRWVYSEDLLGQVHQAGDPAKLEALLADVIRTALA